MADTSLDDGDMARLLARTADMLKQVGRCGEGATCLHDVAVIDDASVDEVAYGVRIARSGAFTATAPA
jgi:hypothetical protein